MDASHVFRQVEGFGTYPQRLPQAFYPSRPVKIEEQGENENSHRIAHTLTACCRCRQRKTRCDPTLPRCLPCERSGSSCEYFDTTKGKKISRYYVVKLQEKVRALEAELGQYTDEDDFPKNNEDFIRPGGLVRLNETDETPRYLGPSSGIAMTRLLMEEAKRYTESTRISELIPEVRGRRRPGIDDLDPTSSEMRSQSLSVLPPTSASRRKSYPMISAVPAQNLPSRAISDKLVEVFCQRGQIFTPIVHERMLATAFQDVYAGSQEPYQNFLVLLIMAISLQKLDATYAGLADSYYLAAMQYFEDILRPKDLKTLQCLILLAQYSLLTPTRTAVYYIVGLATRICQQLGLADEKTIALGATDPMTVDVRRRVSWSVATMEFGLSQSMGRPTGFAKTNDRVDVKFFEPVGDANITENGITPGPTDEKKLVAIHFCKMRELQSEVRRVLYEKRHPEPRDDRHPWFTNIENKMKHWLNTTPESPPWCKPWFTGRFHTMIVSLHRPSPQVPTPSIQSAMKCFNSAGYVINISRQQMIAAAVDITWVFLLTIYMAINALLWSVTYSEIRALHSREEVQDLVNISLEIIDQCAERWPGTSAASQLYSTFAKACLQSYESRNTPALTNASTYNTPPSQSETNSPPGSEGLGGAATVVPKQNAPSTFHPPQFGNVFDSTPEPVTDFGFDNPFGSHPTFRSNSIFHNPATSDHTGRRFSYFPPDYTQLQEASLEEEQTPPASSEATMSPPVYSPPQHTPTPPHAIPASAMSNSILATPLMSAQVIPQTSPSNFSLNSTPRQQQQQQTPTPQQPQPQTRPPMTNFAIPSAPLQQQQQPHQHHHQPPGQRPLPAPNAITDWFNPPPPFISPYTFGAGGGSNTGNPLWGGGGGGGNGPAPNGGSSGMVSPGMGGFPPQFSDLPPERQGSLSQEQQMELYNVLENEGMTDIDTYLNMGMGMGFSNGGENGAVHPSSAPQQQQQQQVHWAGGP